MTVWTVILAAGESARFGGVKALADWRGGTLLSHAISLAPEPDHVVVVTGAHSLPMTGSTRQIHNPDWAAGMGTSIAAGIAFVKGRGAAVALILPVDQPFVTRLHLTSIAGQCQRENQCVLTRDNDVTGPPAAIPASVFTSLQTLKTSGIKSAFGCFEQADGPGMLRDIDTPADLQRFTETG